MKQTEFVSKYADKSAFIALLNCAEVGRRNRISSKLPISVPLSFSDMGTVILILSPLACLLHLGS